MAFVDGKLERGLQQNDEKHIQQGIGHAGLVGRECGEGGQIDQQWKEKNQQRRRGSAPLQAGQQLEKRERAERNQQCVENRADVRVNGQRLKEQPERIQPCADQPFARRSLQRGLKVEAEATQEQQKAAAVERHAQRRTQQRTNGAVKDGARHFLIIGQERLEQADRGQGKEESERAAIQRLRPGQNERAKQCPCANAQTQHDCADRQQNGEKERIRRVNRTGKGGRNGRRKRHRAAEHRNQIRRGEMKQPADER